MKNESIKKLKIPDKPGVYFFRKGKEVLYIGKATSLRDRTRSYFGTDLIATRGPVLVDMVFSADKLEFQQTDSVLEALILEANLIKKHQPRYNTKEKDNKSFNYVVFTREKMPKVLVVRGRELEAHPLKGDIFGPYTSGLQLREALKILRRIFPFIDASSSKKQNYMFYRLLGLTPDESEANETYIENIKYLKLFFRGKKKDIIRDLKKEMKDKAKDREFEKAAEARNQLFALQHINDIALIKEDSIALQRVSGLPRIEAYDIAHMGGKNMTGVMVVVEGSEVCKSEYRKFRIRTQIGANDTGALKEVLERRLKHTEWPFPDVIVVDGSTAQINVANKTIADSGLSIPVLAVVKDERHKPKDILGDEESVLLYKQAALLANSEAHRFAIAYHKNIRNKNFLR